MSRNKSSRISIPGRITQLLLHDDEFFREVSGLKKAATAGSFPKYDQWCDADGFHMEFALAGYARKDIEVVHSGQELTIRSMKPDLNVQQIREFNEAGADITSHDPEEYSSSQFTAQINDIGPHNDGTHQAVLTKPLNTKIQHGSIIRGIARRNFVSEFLISKEFDVALTKASVKDGLLRLLIPMTEQISVKNIEIINGE